MFLFFFGWAVSSQYTNYEYGKYMVSVLLKGSGLGSWYIYMVLT